MNEFEINENQFELINLIIKSSDELILILKESAEINETVHSTISQMFLFMKNIFKFLPEIINADECFKILKKEMLNSFDNAINHWTESRIFKLEFVESWTIFSKLWNEYFNNIEEIRKSSQSFQLSMN